MARIKEPIDISGKGELAKTENPTRLCDNKSVTKKTKPSLTEPTSPVFFLQFIWYVWIYQPVLYTLKTTTFFEYNS